MQLFTNFGSEMSEELVRVRQALVEAVAAQKLIDQKLKKVKEDLKQWEGRAAAAQESDPELHKKALEQAKNLKQLIAEFEADLMSQNDLEKQLKATLFKLEHTVPSAPKIVLPDLSAPFETIQRLEGKILKDEALAKLTEEASDRQLARQSESSIIEDELEALKRNLHKDEESE